MIIYFVSLISFLFFLFFFSSLSSKLKLIDQPNYRKKHIGNIPLIGGLIIYFNILLFIFFYEISYFMSVILSTSFLLILLGALDDAIDLGVTFRLVTQLICCLIVVV